MLYPRRSWPPPREGLRLEDNEVHVWQAALDLAEPQLHTLERTLAEDERTRADTYRFQRDRNRFIAGRGLLRLILGRYLDLEPRHVKFCYNPYGKPILSREQGGHTLSFNVSHSHGLALYALSRHRSLGIDLEKIRLDLPLEEMAERFFAAEEVSALRALPKGRRERAFFCLWTLKEAFIKARGEGLSFALDRFVVSSASGRPVVLLSGAEHLPAASDWSLEELTLGADYAAALAVEGRGWRLKSGRWADHGELV